VIPTCNLWQKIHKIKSIFTPRCLDEVQSTCEPHQFVQ